MAIGLMMLGSEMAGFTVLGVVLDYLLGSMPWATVGLTLAGATVVMIHLRQIVMKRLSAPKPPPPV
jgi:F0F1-type ATP synthase assembly protein I